MSSTWQWCTRKSPSVKPRSRGRARSAPNKKGQENRSCPFQRRKTYFLSSFFAAFLSLCFAFFPSLPSPFFISSFFIGAPAWDAATAHPLDTANTAANNSDNSFFIQRLL